MAPKLLPGPKSKMVSLKKKSLMCVLHGDTNSQYSVDIVILKDDSGVEDSPDALYKMLRTVLPEKIYYALLRKMQNQLSLEIVAARKKQEKRKKR